MSVLPAESQILDGYRLIRFLGRGGFGEVWLCQSEAMGGYHALKFIPERNTELLEKEYQSLALYRKEAAKLRSPHLVPIEHINRNSSGLYYVMPLADGDGDTDPASQAWFPLSLAAFIESRAHAATWYPVEEIISILQPILQALQTLSDAGLGPPRCEAGKHPVLQWTALPGRHQPSGSGLRDADPPEHSRLCDAKLVCRRPRFIPSSATVICSITSRLPSIGMTREPTNSS